MDLEAQTKNKFIVFEGIDGSGKGTQIQLFVDYLISQGEKVWLTKEPTTVSEEGKQIRKVLTKEIPAPDDPMELQRLYVEDRRQHMVEIEKHLANGEWVICDRYLWSTVAYGSASGGNYDTLMAMNSQFRVPDITFLIDIPASLAMQRIENRGEGKQYFEQEEKLNLIRENYLKIAKLYPEIKVIDGAKPVFDIAQDVIQSTVN